MTSMNTNMEGHLDEQPPAKKQRIDDSIGEQQQGSEHPPANGVNADEQKEELETSTTTTTVDLPCPRHHKLPAELNQQIFLCLNPASQRKFIYGLGWDFYAMFRYKLLKKQSDLPKSTELKDEVSETSKTTMDLPMNCEIFKCLKLPIQRKFIWGLGRGIYGIFGQKLLKKTKRVRNLHRNGWNNTNTRATITPNGLNVSNNTNGYPNAFAVQPFPIFGPHCRVDDFPGTILYYYEVKGDFNRCYVGLSGAISDDSLIGQDSNSYAISIFRYFCYGCRLAGEDYLFELPEGAVEQEMKEYGNVYGCGLILDPDNNLAIFFTLNGKLLGRKIPISPTVDRLFPAVTMTPGVTFEANFGDNPAKPFEYDIHNCPSLELACI